MISKLNREQLIDLLEYLGASKIVNNEGKKDIQFTCTVHNESNPSAGINIETNMYNCFSCHSKGDVVWLTYQSSDDFKCVEDAEEFLTDRYNLSHQKSLKINSSSLKRYGDIDKDINKRIELKNYELAPYKSGEETYKYFFDRGFTRETMQKFKIGRDLISKTVTIPLFWKDNVLAGIIGRYIDPNRPKNSRYKIYGLPTSNILYPLQNFSPIDGKVILVEGILDALYMHQCGYTNTLALLTNFISKNQVTYLLNNFKINEIIDFTDNDSMGNIATQSIYKSFKGVLPVTSYKKHYPQGSKDPCDCTEIELFNIINGKCLNAKKSIKRIKY